MDIHLLDEKLIQQQDMLSNAQGLNEQFHPPEPNNFVFSFVSRKLDRNSYYSDWAEQTESLNLADLALLKYCCKFLQDNPDFAATYYTKRWCNCIKDRVNLQGGQWLDAIISRLENKGELNGTFAEHLKVYAPEILELFLQVPRMILEKVRINIYLRSDQALSFVERLISESIPPLNETSERIEIAKEYAMISSRNTTSLFPRVIIYPNNEIVRSQYDFIKWITLIVKLCDSVYEKQQARSECAYVLGENCTLTEGFFLYKRYLKRLDLLDSVYSAASNYSFRHDSKIANYV